MSRTWPYWLISVFAVATVFVYAVKPGGPETIMVLSNVIAVFASGTAFIASLVVSRRKEAEPLVAWRLLSLGLGLFFLGEASWAAQEIFLGIKNPFPSVADLFWMLGYVALFLGLLATWRHLEIGLTAREMVVIGIAGPAALAASAYWLLLPIARASDIGVLEKALDIAYPLADLAIFVPAVALMFTFDDTVCGRTWSLFCVGFVLIAAGDFSFSYLSWNELYWIDVDQPGNYIDLFWVAGYLTIAVGVIYYDRILFAGGVRPQKGGS